MGGGGGHRGRGGGGVIEVWGEEEASLPPRISLDKPLIQARPPRKAWE